jgi:hypothetical protein
MLHFPTLSIDMATPALVQALGQVKDWVNQKSISDSIVWDINSNSTLLQTFMQTMSGDIFMSPTNRTMSITSFQTVQALGLIAACAITGNVSSRA